MKQYRCMFGLVFLVLASFAYAEATSYEFSSIKIEGVVNDVLRDQVKSQIHFSTDELVTSDELNTLIHDIHGTQYFEKINLVKKNSTLIIQVEPRPVIADVTVVSGKSIKEDKISETLDALGIKSGEILKRDVLKQFEASLLEGYKQLGKTKAVLETTVTPLSRNRVDIFISATEGKDSRIRSIKFVGNKNISSRKLKKVLGFSTKNILSAITKKDRFSEWKLGEAQEAIHGEYLDRGYLDADIEASHKFVRKGVDIVFTIDEKRKFHAESVSLKGQDIDKYRKALEERITLQKGEVASRKGVMKIIAAMKQYLGERGYAYAKVSLDWPKGKNLPNPVPIVFNVQPGQKYYVRQIRFVGNYMTSDLALRNYVQQQEGSLLNSALIQETTRQLKVQEYLKSVNVGAKEVEGTNNQVDLEIEVEETSSAKATFGAGYSSDGFLIEVGVNQENFLGTGKYLGMQFRNTRLNQVYSVDYTDPFYTTNGVSRGLHFYSNIFRPYRLDLANYSTNKLGFSVDYGIPITHYDRVSVGVGLEKIKLGLGGKTPPEISQFVTNNGSRFVHSILNVGWSHNSLDRRPFPTKGLTQYLGGTLSVPIGNNKLSYYKFMNTFHHFLPLDQKRRWIIETRTGIGYGDSYDGLIGGLPFFENFFAGGMSSVRGYESSSLGPRDTGGVGDPLGGNFYTDMSVALIFPNFLTEDVRTSLFFDAGNVYNFHASGGSKGRGPLRTSAGLNVEWRLPVIGSISFSFAKAINPGKRDDTLVFDFTIGGSV